MADRAGSRIRHLKIFRPRKDVLRDLDDSELLKRYRLDRAGVLFVTDLVREALESPTGRSAALTAEMKVLITLRYLASGKMQLCSSDDLGPSQSAVSRAISSTLEALTQPEILTRFIKFPATMPEIRRKQDEFRAIAGFVGVAGVIDGTHIRILAPKDQEADFVNRKNFHSINTQLVFDAKYNILDVVANWPGSTNDARIWRECGLKRLFVENRIPPDSCHLLGDSGYPSCRYLLTPYRNPETAAQRAYNRAHKTTRSTVEQGIDQLKQRFHVLHEVRLEPRKVCKVILACALLHNICKIRNIGIPDGDEDFVINPEEGEYARVLVADNQADGTRYREMFANLHFGAEV